MMSDLEEIRARVRLLERSNRCAWALVVALALVPIAIGARSSRTIEAERFVLVDRRGETLSELRSNPDGGSELVFRGEKAVARSVLSVARDGRPSLAFNDAAGHLRTKLTVARDSSLTFYDERGKLRASIGVTGYGPGWLSPRTMAWRPALDSAREFFAIAGIPANSADPGESAVIEPDGQDGPVLKFYDLTGKPRLEARVDADRPAVFLHAADGAIHVMKTSAGRTGEAHSALPSSSARGSAENEPVRAASPAPSAR